MGREVLRVPPDWEHPRIAAGGRYAWEKPGRYHPMRMDRTYAEELRIRAENPEDYDADYVPDPAYYRTREWSPEEATAYQVYETVSEGTPVSPVFRTRADLIRWLTAPIPWDEKYPDLSVQGMSREQAERFVGAGWAPSAVIDANGFCMGAKAL